MDDEDLAELRADQKLVSEHDEMDILGGTQAERDRQTGVDDSQKECVVSRLAHLSWLTCVMSAQSPSRSNRPCYPHQRIHWEDVSSRRWVGDRVRV